MCGFLEETKLRRIKRKIMTEESRFCKNCKRDVSAANFSLHEAHCLRFLTLCPECDEPVAQKDMKDHQTEAHKQAKECHERAVKCKICELEMPFNKLQEHLNTCASRTERCWECNKYVMYKDQNKHKDICQKSGPSSHKDVNFQTSGASTHATLIYPTIGDSDNLCLKCNKSFPDDQYPQHLNKSSAPHMLTKALAGRKTSKPSTDLSQSSSSLAPSSTSENAMAWKDIHPKGKERGQPLTSKTLLKPPKNKKRIGFPSPTKGGLSTSPQVLKDTLCYDTMVTCAHCNILLPLPTLRKHEIKCLRLTSLQNTRMTPKSSHGKEEDSF
ncbi:XIAP-associated factor 1 isoform X2 [Apteryx rowi]|uniref:XIAP-associated factor 1 isoform X2 n=1 Tax=Apteryx rowi TaxID=308060 RepID=UPI000E1D07F2|nr:XIAP-associated factor 1 isoform X2 [Apteryx rowi]